MIRIKKDNFSITTKDIVSISVMLATIEVAKLALGLIAGVEIVSLLFIISTLHFQKKMIYMLPAFCLIEGVLFGFGIWWFMYLYIWPLLVLIVYIFRNNKSIWFWSMLSGIFGVLFGLLCSPVYLVTGGLQMAVSWWVAGIPTDILHGVSNFILCLLLFRPLNKVMNMI